MDFECCFCIVSFTLEDLTGNNSSQTGYKLHVKWMAVCILTPLVIGNGTAIIKIAKYILGWINFESGEWTVQTYCFVVGVFGEACEFIMTL